LAITIEYAMPLLPYAASFQASAIFSDASFHDFDAAITSRAFAIRRAADGRLTLLRHFTPLMLLSIAGQRADTLVVLSLSAAS
jgi:hypothetical protein